MAEPEYVIIVKSRNGEILRSIIGPCSYDDALRVGKEYADSNEVSMFPLTSPA